MLNLNLCPDCEQPLVLVTTANGSELVCETCAALLSLWWVEQEPTDGLDLRELRRDCDGGGK